ncbi:MAG: hypothetical protein WKH64_00465 [Chloroflexia bacterium]
MDALTAALALTATLLLVRYKFNSVWLVLAGALVSIAYKLWRTDAGRWRVDHRPNRD